MSYTAQTLQTVGNWRSEIGVSLETAMHVSMDVMGRSGAEACRHALILMHQSAAAMTPQSKAKRPVESDNMGPYVYSYRQNGTRIKLHKWRYTDESRANAYSALLARKVYGHARRMKRVGTWQSAQRIRAKGLAKRSWMWALNTFGKSGGKPIEGVAWTRRISEGKRNGFSTGNALSYLPKIMPAGWQAAVELAAANKIMAQAANRMTAEAARQMELPRGTRIPRPQLAMYFASQGIA